MHPRTNPTGIWQESDRNLAGIWQDRGKPPGVISVHHHVHISVTKGRQLGLLLCVAVLLAGCGSAHTGGYAPRRADPAPTRQEAAVVNTARTAVGTPYRYGGCDPAQGFDCSGLIWWAYSTHGHDIPRTTSGQAAMGTSVSCDAPRLGDVVVFRIADKGLGLHAGIYSGRGHFVHSPKSGSVVREESLDKQYWQSRLFTCRRILREGR